MENVKKINRNVYSPLIRSLRFSETVKCNDIFQCVISEFITSVKCL